MLNVSKIDKNNKEKKMPFKSLNLKTVDHILILGLGDRIVQTLEFASQALSQDSKHSLVWFGDVSPAWIAYLKSTLMRMAALIKINTIDVGYIIEYAHYSSRFATAYVPSSGWQNYTADQRNFFGNYARRPVDQGFHIGLGRFWHGAPVYRTYYRNESKFMIIAHELSHLLVDTVDIANGYKNSKLLASMHPLHAKSNANNWGYFLEEFCK